MTLDEAVVRLDALGAALPTRPGAIHLDTRGPIAELVLDNPSARTAITTAMMVQLGRAVQALSTWDGAAVILRSTGQGVFCAGGHLGEVRAGLGTADVGREMSLAMSTVLDTLLDLPVLSIAAADGAAIGGGAEILTACDLRFLGPDASIHFVHARLGVATGWGGAARLARLVGRRRALAILHQAAPLDAQSSLAAGLADGVGEGSAEAAARTWLGDPSTRAPAALRALKEQVRSAALSDPDETRSAQAEAFAGVWGGPAHRAALDELRRGRG